MITHQHRARIEETTSFLNLVVKSKTPMDDVGAMKPYEPRYLLMDFFGDSRRSTRRRWAKACSWSSMTRLTAHVTLRRPNTSNADTFPQLGTRLPGLYAGRTDRNFFCMSTNKQISDTEFDVAKLPVPARGQHHLWVFQYEPNPDRRVLSPRPAIRGLSTPGLATAAWRVPHSSRRQIEARKKGVIVVRSTRVGNGIVARNGEAKDDAG